MRLSFLVLMWTIHWSCNKLGGALRLRVWAYLTKMPSIEDLGEARWTLQMTVQRDIQGGVLKISQENFFAKVLRRFNMANCSNAPTPAVDTRSPKPISPQQTLS